VFGVLRLYGETAVLAARRGLRAWPVAFSLVLYAAILYLTVPLVAPLGLAGGLVIGLVSAACLSSYLHLISHAVAGTRLHFADLRRSFGARFWDVVSVMFVLWILRRLLQLLAEPAGARGPVIMALAGLAIAVFFNPVPELLYQGTSRSLQLLLDSIRFISRYGLEWLIPNVLFALALLAPVGLLHGPPGQVVLTVTGILTPDSNGVGLLLVFIRAPWFVQLPMLLFVHWVMVFRGILWKELESGGPRQRGLREVWRR
jgi:hypothetical protein